MAQRASTRYRVLILLASIPALCGERGCTCGTCADPLAREAGELRCRHEGPGPDPISTNDCPDPCRCVTGDYCEVTNAALNLGACFGNCMGDEDCDPGYHCSGRFGDGRWVFTCEPLPCEHDCEPQDSGALDASLDANDAGDGDAGESSDAGDAATGCGEGQHSGGDGACVPIGDCTEGFTIEGNGHCARWRTVEEGSPPRSHDARMAVLEDGTALVAGGTEQEGWDGASLFDPVSEQWQEVGPMPTGRRDHTLTALEDGRALAVGGEVMTGDSLTDLDSVESYDPVTQEWQEVAPLDLPRRMHSAIRLSDGRVLVMGGFTGESDREGLYDMIIYDPVMDTWESPVGKEKDQWTGTETANTAIAPLGDGRIFITGSDGGMPESMLVRILDPSDGTIEEADDLPLAYSPITPLADGRVLALGGFAGNAVSGDVEAFDPDTGSWTHLADTPSGWPPGAALTRDVDDSVMLLGTGSGLEVPILNPEDASWSDGAPFVNPHAGVEEAARLRDGRVLVVGGYSDPGNYVVAPPEIYEVGD